MFSSRAQPQETNTIDISQYAYITIRDRMASLDPGVASLTVKNISKLFKVVPDQEAQSTNTLGDLFNIFERNMVVSDETLVKYLELSVENPNQPQSSAGFFFTFVAGDSLKTN
jgi:hypothetical protein